MPVCSTNYFQRFGAEPAFDDLSAEQIFTIHGSESDWSKFFEQVGLTAPLHAKVTRLDSSLIALQAVCAGPGVAIVLENFAQPYIEQGLVVSPLAEKLAIGQAHYFVARDGSERRDEVRAFSNWIRRIHANLL